MTDPAHTPEIVGQPRREVDETIQRPAKLIRIASMVKGLLEEVRQSPPDTAGRRRLREIYEHALAELKDGLSEDLQQELDTFAFPLEETPTESEIRVAKAQLVGWLEGLFHGIQAALWAQHVQSRAQFEEMRRRGLPPAGGQETEGSPGHGQYL